MKRGRKPTENGILKLRGSRALSRSDRSTPPPSEDLATLDPPCELNEPRARIWKDITGQMADMHTLGQVSAYTLLRLVDLTDAFNRSTEMHNGNEIAATYQRAKLAPAIARLEAALGLTPGDRRNVTPSSPRLGISPENPLDRLMRGDPCDDVETPSAPATAKYRGL